VDVLSRADIELVMDTADEMSEILARPIPKVPALRGTSVTILFYEASTRTRVSFEVAAKNLSADVVNIAAASSVASAVPGAHVEALGVDMLVIATGVGRCTSPRRSGGRCSTAATAARASRGRCSTCTFPSAGRTAA
jgi:hypothetical protein